MDHPRVVYLDGPEERSKEDFPTVKFLLFEHTVRKNDQLAGLERRGLCISSDVSHAVS